MAPRVNNVYWLISSIGKEGSIKAGSLLAAPLQFTLQPRDQKEQKCLLITSPITLNKQYYSQAGHTDNLTPFIYK